MQKVFIDNLMSSPAPIYDAAQEGLVAVVRVLADLPGADLDRRPKVGGFTPVGIAAQNGHAEVVRLLASLGANIETPNKDHCTPAYTTTIRTYLNPQQTTTTTTQTKK